MIGLGYFSIHLDVASFVLLFSNERAYYLEHQDFVLLPKKLGESSDSF